MTCCASYTVIQSTEARRENVKFKSVDSSCFININFQMKFFSAVAAAAVCSSTSALTVDRGAAMTPLEFKDVEYLWDTETEEGMRLARRWSRDPRKFCASNIIGAGKVDEMAVYLKKTVTLKSMRLYFEPSFNREDEREFHVRVYTHDGRGDWDREDMSLKLKAETICGWVTYTFPAGTTGNDVTIHTVSGEENMDLQTICGWEVYGTEI